MNSLLSEKTFRYGLILVGIIGLCILLGPYVLPASPAAQNLAASLQPPTQSHPLGTDFYGRDVLTRLIYGGQITLGIALFATIIAVGTGTLIGLISGYFNGWLDRFCMRMTDVFLGFPKIFILLLMIGLGQRSLMFIVLILALFSWMEITRIVRSEVLSIKERLYIKSAIALGLRRRRIVFRHILPNVGPQIIVATVLMIATMILLESSLSFLGLGVPTPRASWGSILKDGRIDLIGAWWISLSAGLAIILTVVGFNLLGEGLRKRLDPQRNHVKG